jgi:PAS domain-containing protein
MRIVYHLGAHCTDEDRLVRNLLKNRALLAQQGIVVPSPTRYRKLLRDTVVQLRGMPASDETQALILEQIMDEPAAERLVLSWDSFMSFPAWALRGGLYAAGGERVRAFTQIFPDIEAEFHLALRNPATFLPALQDRVNAKGREDILTDIDPQRLHWSDAVEQILAYNPGVPLTIWCDEETPLIWPEVLAGVAGVAPGTDLADSDEILSLIMNDIGFARMRSYCAEHPPQSVSQRRRVVTAFLEKFARPDAVEVDIDLPGWTAELVADLTNRYLHDVERIRRLPGVTLLSA